MPSFENGRIVPIEFNEGEAFEVAISHEDPELEREIDRRAEEKAKPLAAEMFLRYLAEIMSHKNPLMCADAFNFASGLHMTDGHSETYFAKKHGVTRQAFSKQVLYLKDKFGLKNARGMKSEEARETYARAQKERKK